MVVMLCWVQNCCGFWVESKPRYYPFKAPVGASLLANNTSLLVTAPFASKLAPTRERATGYAHLV